jgi:hypothetical protein
MGVSGGQRGGDNMHTDSVVVDFRASRQTFRVNFASHSAIMSHESIRSHDNRCSVRKQHISLHGWLGNVKSLVLQK